MSYSPKTELEFEEIANECIAEAEAVKCSKHDFVNGLELIEEMVRDRRKMMEEEIERDESGE